MQLSIFAITIPPPCIPGDLHQKFTPTLGFCNLAFARGWGFVGVAPEGRAFVYKQVLLFLEFLLQWQELLTDNTLAFICCSEILCFK